MLLCLKKNLNASRPYYELLHCVSAHQLVAGDKYKDSTRDWNYPEDYWPGAGGLSAMNAIGTQLRDPINSGLTRWAMAM